MNDNNQSAITKPVSELSVSRTLVRSILVGSLFSLLVLFTLLGLTMLERIRFGYWDFYWILDRGFLPIAGIFLVTSSSYVWSKMIPTRFVFALTTIAATSVFAVILAGNLGWLRVGKGSSYYWFIPFDDMIVVMAVACGTMAALAAIYRTVRGRFRQPGVAGN